MTSPQHFRHGTHIFSLATAFLTAALLMAGCGAGDGETGSSSASDSTLRVGSDLTYPPYTYLEDGQPAGFDPDFVDALGREIDREPQVQDIRFEQLIASLKSNRIDVIASALYITAERAQEVEYIPYFTTGNSIVVASDGEPLADAQDLCGLSVGVIKGGDIVQRLREDASAECEEAGEEPVDVSEFTTDPEATQALISGQVDAQVTDAAVAKEAVEKTSGQLTITSEALLYPIPVGLAVDKENTELAAEIRAGLKEMRDSGEYAELLDNYNLQEPDQARVDDILGS